jgi:ADP-ribose pyrophosphatase YjhB (NUDIX family)
VGREPIPTWGFAIVVVRKADRFLVVHEKKHGQLWYLPAGRVEPGETFAQGALRETLEESGVPVTLTGILRIQHTPNVDGTARMRVIFVAEPTDDSEPLSEPNKHSLEARWVTLTELDELPLRSSEVRTLFRAVAEGAPVHPLDVMRLEGDG